MLTRRDLRIKAFQAVFALKQRVKSNQQLALDYIEDYFAPNLNSSEKQDVQLLKKKREVAKNLFLESRHNPDILRQETDEAILSAIDLAKNLVREKNELDRSEVIKLALKDLNKLEEAYVSSLQFILEIANVTAKKDGDWIANRLSENHYIKLLDQSKDLLAQVGKYAVNWDDEEQLPRQVYLDKLFHLEVIEEMNKSVKTDQDFDFKVIKKILKKGLYGVKSVQQVFDESDSYWKENQNIVEKNIVRTFKQAGESLKLFLLEGDHWESDRSFFKQLVEAGTEFDSDVEQAYLTNLKNWEREKLTDTDDVIILLALNEMNEFPSIPLKVTINEYIEITKLYSTPKSQGFVNGIVDSISSIMKDQGMIKKSGRGLLDNQ